MAVIKNKKAQIADSEFWIQIDPDTGKSIGNVKEVDVVLKPAERNGFMITYLSTIIQMIDKLGNQKMKVVKYLLSKMSKSENTLIKTVEEISKETGISDKTIRETLKLLKEADIISRRPGVIMLSPKLVHRGDKQKERYLMTKFQEMQGVQTIDFSNVVPNGFSPEEFEKIA